MDAIDQIKRLLTHCSAPAKQELMRLLRQENPIHGLEAKWNVTAEVVLEAIDRSSELTQRMFRGILAEAACKVEVIDRLEGWKDITTPGNQPYDFRLKKGRREVTVQTKLQRSLKGAPMTADQAPRLVNPRQYVVETQKTRAGESGGQSTRPYRFGEFDILAVSMQPVTKDWRGFRFTVGRWLISRPADANLIAIYQPVSLEPDEDWTDDLAVAVEWFFSSENKTIRNTTPQVN